MVEKVYERYQGKEIEVTLQAPDEPTLRHMIGELEGYASKVGLEPPEVLNVGPDPDGGFKAIVIAHNVNLFKWVEKTRAKWEARGGGYQARLATKQTKVGEHVARREIKAKHMAAMSKLRARELAAQREIAKARGEIGAARVKELTTAAASAGRTIGTGVATGRAYIAGPGIAVREAAKTQKTLLEEIYS